MRGSIYFNDNYDVDGVEEIVEQFKEADLWYREKEVRFIGTAEKGSTLTTTKSRHIQPALFYGII